MSSKSQKTKTDMILLNQLVCPLTGGPLEISKNRDELISRTAKIAYPVRDGIPIMVASEARALIEKELKK